jgi:hypothetical protein
VHNRLDIINEANKIIASCRPYDIFALVFAFNVRNPANIISHKNKLFPCQYP